MKKSSRRLARVAAAALALIVFYIIYRTVKLPVWASYLLFGAVYLAAGYDVLFKAVRGIVRGKLFDENFLMAVATIGAFVIGEFLESAAVMLLYQIGEVFQEYAVGKSRRSVSDLMNIRPDRAVVLRGGVERTVAPEEVSAGEVIVIRAGERIPLDGTVVEGQSSLDTSALTGESVPRSCRTGDAVMSGSINCGGLIKIRADKVFYDSTVSKILDMVENAAGKKAKTEKFITKFARWYTPAVVAVAVLLTVVPGFITGAWLTWLIRSLNFLVVSCPCALVISVPLGFFGGIGAAGKRGVLIKGGGYLELLARADTFVFDKTGTLTKGSFEVTDVRPEALREEILTAAAIAENGSLHPIARSVLAAVGKKPDTDGWRYEEIAGRGIEAVKGGDVILCGNAALLESRGIVFTQQNAAFTLVYVARGGRYLGVVTIADRVKDEAAGVIRQLRAEGCRTVMLTGDSFEIAKAVGAEVDVDEVRAELLPGDKVAELEKLLAVRKSKGGVAFVGDGINDAPVLMRADIGVSMGGVGSDSAIEASDVVLMHDTLTSIPESRRIAKKTLRIVGQNILFALIVKAAVLALSAFGLATMWAAVFADVGVSVLAVLNSMRSMRVKDVYRQRSAEKRADAL